LNVKPCPKKVTKVFKRPLIWQQCTPSQCQRWSTSRLP